jgi:hypothetical protein
MYSNGKILSSFLDKFFVHDPPESGGDTVWFQGRFFPSTSSGNGGRSIGGDSNVENRRDKSPTSVLVSSEQINHPIMAENSWGILATQNALVDECLACDEGGYRELDLTFIRRKTRQTRRESANVGGNNKTTTARWAACDIIWTGGNMMTLNASSYAGDCDDEDDVKFEPRKLVEGDAAMSIASRYFPEMTKRLRIHNALSCDNKSLMPSSSLSSVGGKRSRNVAEEEEYEEENGNVPMVIIGDMQVIAPASFVRMKGAGLDDHDNKWDEDADSI